VASGGDGGGGGGGGCGSSFGGRQWQGAAVVNMWTSGC